MSIRTRSPLIYRLALALPVVVWTVLRFGGHWPPSQPLGTGVGPASPGTFSQDFAASVAWILGLVPLGLLSWELGRQHVAARRLGYTGLLGLRELVRIAWTGALPAEAAATYTRPPSDNPGRAMALGIGVGAFVPVFFASFMPALQSPMALAWLAGAGILMGTTVYCSRRAAAYLQDEPQGWGIARRWLLLNPDRYAPEGRVFVRGVIIASTLLPFWWLGGGEFVITRQ